MSAHDFEDHEPCTVEQFQQRLKSNEFALHWYAHDTFYGITFKSMQCLFDSHYEHTTNQNKATIQHIVANVSRSIIKEAQEKFPFRVVVIEVNANETIVRERLMKRGRETTEQINARIAHNKKVSATVAQVAVTLFVVWNDSSVEEGILKFVEALSSERKSKY